MEFKNFKDEIPKEIDFNYDKARPNRFTEEWKNNVPIYPFEEGKIYSISTPYNLFGTGEILMEMNERSLIPHDI